MSQYTKAINTWDQVKSMGANRKIYIKKMFKARTCVPNLVSRMCVLWTIWYWYLGKIRTMDKVRKPNIPGHTLECARRPSCFRHFLPDIGEVNKIKGSMISPVWKKRFQRTPDECKATYNLVHPNKNRWIRTCLAFRIRCRLCLLANTMAALTHILIKLCSWYCLLTNSACWRPRTYERNSQL
jgi:hypothetical protein